MSARPRPARQLGSPRDSVGDARAVRRNTLYSFSTSLLKMNALSSAITCWKREEPGTASNQRILCICFIAYAFAFAAQTEEVLPAYLQLGNRTRHMHHHFLFTRPLLIDNNCRVVKLAEACSVSCLACRGRHCRQQLSSLLGAGKGRAGRRGSDIAFECDRCSAARP